MTKGAPEVEGDHSSVTEQWNLLQADELTMLIERCALNDRHSQKKIYYSFYGYAMSICRRYTSSHDDSIEILNDGFLKIFKEVHHYKPAYADVIASFAGWLRKIMIYTAIDHFRRNSKYRFTTEIDDGMIQLSAGGEDALDSISYEEMLRSVQELTPGYRTVFNLFAIEGFTHEEISNQLGISIGTSKSNLARARRQLQKKLFEQNRVRSTEAPQEMDSSKIFLPEDGQKEECALDCPAGISCC